MLTLAVALFLASADPQPVLRASPRVGLAPLHIRLSAQLKGGAETERFYCPRVEWEWPDGTRSSQESDCSAFADRDDYPRSWRREVLSGPGTWTFTVRFFRGDRLLSQVSETVSVLGGEP